MGRLGSRRRRRRYAVVACVLWLLGIEVLPNLHLTFHDDDHTHGHAGTIVVARVAIDDHAHDGEASHSHATAHHSELAYDEDETAIVVEEEPAPAPTRRHRDQLAIEPFDPGHAAGGLAHRLLALQQPAPPLLAPVEVPRVAWWISNAPIERTSVAPHARPTARGPPFA
jgi:hypothetical protein